MMRRALAAFSLFGALGCASGPTAVPLCNATGAPPIQTVAPVTTKPTCTDGRVLSFDQNGVERFACLNLPPQASVDRRKWPLVIYLHGSETNPDSLYQEGRSLFDLHRTYDLSADPEVHGFIILSPGARRAEAWPAPFGATGTGPRWDEWYRDSATNLDAAAIDHFLDEVLATGLVDANRIYVFGWSNGAFTSALYGVWRADRIAAIAQYAGANPWSRQPCPIPLPAAPHTPLILVRNLCDAVVPCNITSEWIGNLTDARWPFESYNLLDDGSEAPAGQGCAADCPRDVGIHDHIRWPHKSVIEGRMLPFLKRHVRHAR